MCVGTTERVIAGEDWDGFVFDKKALAETIQVGHHVPVSVEAALTTMLVAENPTVHGLHQGVGAARLREVDLTTVVSGVAVKECRTSEPVFDQDAVLLEPVSEAIRGDPARGVGFVNRSETDIKVVCPVAAQDAAGGVLGVIDSVESERAAGAREFQVELAELQGARSENHWISGRRRRIVFSGS